MPYWKESYSLVPEDFPKAEARFWRTVSLPLYPALTLDQVDRVCAELRHLLEGP
jgi:dTDP-4-amino-4,6-dideoxygalactose transaminase